MKKALALSPAKYKKMSDLGLKHIKNNYSFENLEKTWVSTMDEIIEKHGSWSTRVGYNKWTLQEVA